VGIRAHAPQRAGEQRHAVADREQAYVEKDVSGAKQEEHDADQEEQMVVARDHVLRAEIHQRPHGRAVE
jgi:hypothetical protein